MPREKGRPVTEAAGFEQFALRIPSELLDQVRQEARDHGRPVNTQIVWIIHDWCQHPKRLKAPTELAVRTA